LKGRGILHYSHFADSIPICLTNREFAEHDPMQLICDVVAVSPLLLALTHEELPRSQIPARIRGMFDIVYRWLRDAPVRQAGPNYALYDQCTPQTLRVQVGFPVSGPFADSDRVRCVRLASGRAAHAVHVGEYATLHRTYAVLHGWCSEQALPLTGQSWEVYCDPTESPSRLETGLFLRVDGCSA
jgi:effector-binding domain-containing protein